MIAKISNRILFPLDCARTGSLDILQYMKEFKASQFLSRKELDELSFVRMKKILEYSYQNVEFYKNSFDAYGFNPSNVHSPSDLQSLPVLEKHHIQDNLKQLIANKTCTEDLVLDRTGGSTGTPIEYYYSTKRSRSRKAATWRHNGFVDWHIGDKTAILWGASRDIPKNKMKQRLRNLLIDRNMFFNTAGFRPREIIEFNKQLKRFRPKVIQAYANSIGLFAQYFREKGIRPFSPKAIVTSAEMLTPENRKLIEDTFSAPVFNRYGSREFSIIASECKRRDGLHVMQEGLYVEIMKEGRHLEEGETGELIITDLLNFAMPLIRYRIGDAACWKHGNCTCGRGLRRLSNIAGRTTDFLLGADGRLCSGAVLTVAMVAERPSLGQIQLEQNEQNRIICRIAPKKGKMTTSDDKNYLIQQVKQYLGEGTSIDFEIVSRIDHELSGKYRFSKSTLSNLFQVD
jgi:phenylacetate-CoA ligase